MTIRNINPEFGSTDPSVTFENVEEMQAALDACGYASDDGTLREGRDYEVVSKVRIFRGDESRQIDADGNKADPEKWYYEPADYDGDVLWSCGYGSRAEAYHAAGCSTE